MDPTTEPLLHCEVMWYDEEFRRLHRLEKCVPCIGEVHGEYEVTRVRQSKQTHHGIPIVFVYVRKLDVALTPDTQGVESVPAPVPNT